MAEQSTFQKTPKFKGEILLCEDTEINQYVIKSLLSRLGFDIVIANHGEECVDIVSNRVKNGERRFDLIFMDINMPVMGGLEAADTLIKLGNQTPIVALTANTTPKDMEIYSEHGMPDSLNKPIVMEELLSCLPKYFTPLDFEIVDEEKNAADKEKQNKRLLTSFVKRNQTTFGDIIAAIEVGDIKLAHRLAHTLAGLAGLMGKTTLQEASRTVEHSLATGSMEHIKEQLSLLEPELKAVLDELSPLLNEQRPQAPKAFNKEKVIELFERLEPLLLADSAMCLRLADELREIPGTDDLIAKIEDYEFELAFEALISLKKALEV